MAFAVSCSTTQFTAMSTGSSRLREHETLLTDVRNNFDGLLVWLIARTRCRGRVELWDTDLLDSCRHNVSGAAHRGHRFLLFVASPHFIYKHNVARFSETSA